MAAGTRDRPLALITGASGGIGEAFAHLLAAEAYSLVLVARRNGELNRVAGVVTSRYDVPVTAIDADLSVPDAPASLKETLDNRRMSPDVNHQQCRVGPQSRGSRRNDCRSAQHD